MKTETDGFLGSKKAGFVPIVQSEACSAGRTFQTFGFFRSALVFLLTVHIAALANGLRANGTTPGLVLPENKDAYAAVQSIVTTSTLIEGGLRGVSVQTIDVMKGRYREDSILGINHEAEGFDGQSAWFEDAGARVRDDESFIARVGAANKAYCNALAYWFPGRSPATTRSLGQRKEGSKTFEVVSAQPIQGQPLELWFDTTTHLLVRTIGPGLYNTITTYYSHFKPVHNLLLPFSIRINRGDPRFDRILEVESIQLNPVLADEAFAMPQDGPPDYIRAGSFPCVIPFRLISNLIVVDAVVNGKKLPFILDTGGVNLLFPETAKELGLSSEGEYSGHGGGPDEVVTARCRVDSLEFASAYFRPQIFMVYPFPTLRETIGVSNLGGLLGYEIFKRFVVKIDYPRREITFSLPERYTYNGRGTVVPFHFFKNDVQINGAVNSIPTSLLVDTGNTGSLILNSSWVNSHRQLFPAAFDRPYTAVGAAGGNAKFVFAPVASLALGSCTFHSVTAALSLESTGATGTRYSDGIAGAQLFRGSAVTFDYPRHRMIIETTD